MGAWALEKIMKLTPCPGIVPEVDLLIPLTVSNHLFPIDFL